MTKYMALQRLMPRMCYFSIGSFVVVGTILLLCESVSVVILGLLGKLTIPVPWLCLRLLHSGDTTLVGVATVLTGILIGAVLAWCQGGMQRSYANRVLISLGLAYLSSLLSVWVFTLWAQTTLPCSPWLLYSLLQTLPHNSLAFDHLCICVLGCSGSVVGLAMILWWLQGDRIPKRIKHSLGQAHFASLREIQRAGLFSPEGLIIGKIAGKTVRLSGNEAILVVAPTGSGKTSAIAIPNLLTWSDSAVVNDLKGELFALTNAYRQHVFGHHCVRFAPTCPSKQTAYYNPFFYVRDHQDLRIRDCQLIAEILIPAEKVDGGFWYTSSRDIFLALALYYLETQGTVTLATLHDCAKREDFFAWLAYTAQEETVKERVFYQNAYSLLQADEKTQRNILKDFHSRLSVFTDPLIRHATQDNTIDLRQLRREKISIYLHIPDSDKQRLKPVLTLFWAQLTDLMTQYEPDVQQEPYKVLALLDEFGSMARIDHLKNGVSFYRSYRIRPIIMVQYLSQLIATYGPHDAKGFLNAKVRCAFAVNDFDDARLFSAMLGQKTVKTQSHSVSQGERTSTSHTRHYQARPLLTPAEIMQLPRKNALVLVEAQPPLNIRKQYWFTDNALYSRLRPFLNSRGLPARKRRLIALVMQTIRWIRQRYRKQNIPNVETHDVVR